MEKSHELNRLILIFRNWPMKDKSFYLGIFVLGAFVFEPLRNANLKIFTFKTVMTLVSGGKTGEVHAWTFQYLKHKNGWKEITVSQESVLFG